MEQRQRIGKRVGEALAAVGVIGSLVFVALEVRQNTAAVRGATLQAVSQQSLDLVIIGIENPDVRAAIQTAAAERPLTGEQEGLLRWFLSAKLRADENRFRQVQLGTLDADNFGQLSNNFVYRLPYFAQYWAEQSEIWADDYRIVVEREFIPLVGTLPEAARQR